MWGNKGIVLVVIIFALLLTGLFHKQSLGLNLLISEVVFIIWLIISKQFSFRGFYQWVLGLGLIITAISTVVTHSVFSYTLNFIVLFIFIGLLIYPDTKSLLNTIGQSFSNIFNSQIQFFNKLTSSKLKGQKLGSYLKRTRIFIIPIFIIILFVII